MENYDEYWRRDRAWTAPVTCCDSPAQSIATPAVDVFAKPPPYALAVRKLLTQRNGQDSNEIVPPARNNATPAVNNRLPAGNNEPPAVKKAIPACNKAPLVVNKALPAENNAILPPAANNAPPAANNAPPAANNAPPAANNATSATGSHEHYSARLLAYTVPHGSLFGISATAAGCSGVPTDNYISPTGTYGSPAGSFGPAGSCNLAHSCLSPSDSYSPGHYWNEKGEHLSPVGSFMYHDHLSPTGSSLSQSNYLCSADSYCGGFLNPAGSNDTSLSSSMEGSYILSPAESLSPADSQTPAGSYTLGKNIYENVNILPSAVLNQCNTSEMESLYEAANLQPDKYQMSENKESAGPAKGTMNTVEDCVTINNVGWLTINDTAELATLDGKSIIRRLLKQIHFRSSSRTDGSAHRRASTGLSPFNRENRNSIHPRKRNSVQPKELQKTKSILKYKANRDVKKLIDNVSSSIIPSTCKVTDDKIHELTDGKSEKNKSVACINAKGLSANDKDDGMPSAGVNDMTNGDASQDWAENILSVAEENRSACTPSPGFDTLQLVKKKFAPFVDKSDNIPSVNEAENNSGNLPVNINTVMPPTDKSQNIAAASKNDENKNILLNNTEKYGLSDDGENICDIIDNSSVNEKEYPAGNENTAADGQGNRRIVVLETWDKDTATLAGKHTCELKENNNIAGYTEECTSCTYDEDVSQGAATGVSLNSDDLQSSPPSINDAHSSAVNTLNIVIREGTGSMVARADGPNMDGQSLQPHYSPQTYYYAEREPHHHRDPPPYPGHYKHLYQAGYRQSYSGSEASTDLSSTSTENLSTLSRQDPQGEETLHIVPSPGPLDSPTCGDFSMLSQLTGLPVEIRTSNNSTFYMTGSRGTSGSPELQSQSTSPVSFHIGSQQLNSSPNNHTMYSTSPISQQLQQPQQYTAEMLAKLRLACHSPQPQGAPRPEIQRPATAPPIPVPTTVTLVTQNPYPPPPSYPNPNTTMSESLRRSYELLDRLPHTRSQPDLTRPPTSTTATENIRPQQAALTAPAAKNQQTSPNTQHKQLNNSDKKKVELDHAAIATRATQMVERLSQENRSLRQELDNYLKKVSKLQKFEMEIQKVNDAYENLVKHSQKRENLERMLRFRLEAEVKKQRDANIKLRTQIDSQSKDSKDWSDLQDNETLLKEQNKQESLIAKLLNQNKELMANNERLDIEIAAQRATLQEQRNHIDILDSALVNAQANIIRLQEQLRKKAVCEERLNELEDVVSEVQQTSDKRQLVEMKLRQHLEDQLKRLRSQQSGSSLSSLNRLTDTDEGISSDSESTSTVQTLVSQIHDKEKRILELESESLKWEQKYLEERALRQMAVSVASTPKDARIAALEQSSVETERMIAEARTERLQHLDEVYQANRKAAELEARVKSLQAQIAERDAMINVLQRHSSLSRCSSISSLLGSPLHSPNPSLLVTPITSPRISPTAITSISSPPTAISSRQNSHPEMNTLLGRDTLPAHTKSNSTGTSSSLTTSPSMSKETQIRDLHRKLAAKTALFQHLQSREEEVQGLWQV